MSTFKHAKVWHSGLKWRSPLVVKFSTGQVLQSQYKEPDGTFPNLIYFEVRGDPRDDYYYRVENDAIAEKLDKEARSGVWYELRADGQNEEATLELKEVDESSLPPVSEVAVSGGDNSYSKNTSSYTPVSSRVNLVEKMALALEQALDLVNMLPADPSNEDVRALATTMYIQWSDRGFAGPITGEEAPEAEDTPAEDEGFDASEIQELLDNLPLKSGTSHDNRQLKTAISKIEQKLEAGITEATEFNSIVSWLKDELEHQTTDPGEEELPF